jgi:hypothetical protein
VDLASFAIESTCVAFASTYSRNGIVMDVAGHPERRCPSRFRFWFLAFFGAQYTRIPWIGHVRTRLREIDKLQAAPDRYATITRGSRQLRIIAR